MSKINVDASTGEIVEAIESSTDNVEITKFRSMWSNPYEPIIDDYSDEFADVFEEIPPYAVDPKTGEFINNSSKPILKKTGKVNIHEKIQSFKDDVDLYRILEKFAYSDDPAIINARQCSYGDIADFPNDLNGFAQFVNKQFDKLNSVNPELAKMVIDDNYSASDIEAKANEILKSRIDTAKQDDKGEIK